MNDDRVLVEAVWRLRDPDVKPLEFTVSHPPSLSRVPSELLAGKPRWFSAIAGKIAALALCVCVLGGSICSLSAVAKAAPAPSTALSTPPPASSCLLLADAGNQPSVTSPITAPWEQTKMCWSKGGFRDIVNAASAPVYAVGLSFGRVGIYSTNGHLQLTIATQAAWLFSMALSPDGQTLATSDEADHSIKLWCVRDGRCLQTIIGHLTTVLSLAFSPDSQFLASGSVDKTIKIWQVSDAMCVQIINADQTVSHVTFSPNGQLVASAGQIAKPKEAKGKGQGDAKPAPPELPTEVKVWRVNDGVCLCTFKAIQETVNFSPDGQLLAIIGMDGLPCNIQLMRWQNGVCVHTLHCPGWVYDAVFAPDGQTLVSNGLGNNRFLKRWSVDTGACLHTYTYTAEKDNADFLSFAFSADGQTLATITQDSNNNYSFHRLEFWRMSDDTCLKTLDSDSGTDYRVALTPDGKKLATVGYDNKISIWDVSDGSCLDSFPGDFHSLAISPDGQVVAYGTYSGGIRLQHLDNEASLAFTGHSQTLMRLAFSPDSRTLASCSADQTIKFWQVSDGACLHTCTGHTDLVLAIAFSPDGLLLASTSRDATVKLWRVNDGHCINTLHGNHCDITAVAFSPHGQYLAAADADGTIRAWRLADLMRAGATGDDPLFTFNAGAKWGTLFFMPDEQTLAVVGQLHSPVLSDYIAVKLWRMRDGTCLRTMPIPTSTRSVDVADFSRDGKTLAVGGWDGVAVLRDDTR